MRQHLAVSNLMCAALSFSTTGQEIYKLHVHLIENSGNYAFYPFEPWYNAGYRWHATSNRHATSCNRHATSCIRHATSCIRHGTTPRTACNYSFDSSARAVPQYLTTCDGDMCELN